MVNENNGRFYTLIKYEADLFGQPGVICENGSLNSHRGTIRIYAFDNLTSRDKFYNSKAKAKFKRGYK